MLAALAQHLCAALVPLDVDAAHGALLDGSIRVPVGANSRLGAGTDGSLSSQTHSDALRPALELGFVIFR